MKEQYKELSYKITDDKEFIFDLFNIPGALRAEFPQIYADAQKGSDRIIHRLEKLIGLYPHVPQLKNYLSVAYHARGNSKKGYSLNHQIIKEHPDYLFGKLNLAHEYFHKGEYEKIPELLGPLMELQELYPERDTFHISELTGFLKIAIMYFCATGRLEAAEPRYDIMDEIAQGHPDTKAVIPHIVKARVEAASRRMEEENRTRISVTTKSRVRLPQTRESPNFRNTQIRWLYENGLRIDRDKLQAILDLPREELIEDLKAVLKDSMARFEYFSEIEEKEGWKEPSMNFTIHAIYLLGELRATHCLPEVLETFHQDEAYIELWFGDFITGSLWEPLLHMVGEQLDLLLEFVLSPGVYTYSRSEVCYCVAQLAHHHAERKDEITSWFSNLFNELAKKKKTDNVIDSDFTGLAISDAMELQDLSLLGPIKKLFDLGYVSKGVCGSYESLEKELQNPTSTNDKKQLLNIYDRYRQIISSWAGYQEKKEPIPGLTPPELSLQSGFSAPESVFSVPKTGRNDPCPCGSGKKYKKCCL